MKARLAKKIQKQKIPPETDDRNRSYRYRYNRAWLYSQRLYRKLLQRRRKDGRLVWTGIELDKVVNEAISEEYGILPDYFTTYFGMISSKIKNVGDYIQLYTTN